MTDVVLTCDYRAILQSSCDVVREVRVQTGNDRNVPRYGTDAGQQVDG